MNIGSIEIKDGVMFADTVFSVNIDCGCDYHGDHLGCSVTCKTLGCAHPAGKEVSCNRHAYVHGGSNCPNCGVGFKELCQMMEQYYTTKQWL